RYKIEVFPHSLTSLQRVHGGAVLSEQEWASFLPKFSGDPEGIVKDKILNHEAQVKVATERSGTVPTMEANAVQLRECALAKLKAEMVKVGELIGADNKNAQRLKQLSDSLVTQETRRRRLEEELKRAQRSGDRIQEVLEERGQLYGRFFDLIIEQ